ncbi:hypothetical protein BGW80DRAFT_1253421 [Lactifluus volemus]|nr:hypothetical protein BGW80DRAFT_1253421 [Lactifluus volemus]
MWKARGVGEKGQGQMGSRNGKQNLKVEKDHQEREKAVETRIWELNARIKELEINRTASSHADSDSGRAVLVPRRPGTIPMYSDECFRCGIHGHQSTQCRLAEDHPNRLSREESRGHAGEGRVQRPSTQGGLSRKQVGSKPKGMGETASRGNAAESGRRGADATQGIRGPGQKGRDGMEQSVINPLDAEARHTGECKSRSSCRDKVRVRTESVVGGKGG